VRLEKGTNCSRPGKKRKKRVFTTRAREIKRERRDIGGKRRTLFLHDFFRKETLGLKWKSRVHSVEEGTPPAEGKRGRGRGTERNKKRRKKRKRVYSLHPSLMKESC